MLVRPHEMNFSNKKFSMIISGPPGVGKTTLGLSAPTPVLIDFDDGISRVRAQHRTPTIICSTYEQVLEDLERPEINEFETIVVDTGGSLITYMSAWAIRKDAKNGQTNAALYSALKHGRCIVCGIKGEVHHYDTIGMGHDRRKVDDEDHRKICLCRKHHVEAHQIGRVSFEDKYKVYGIVYRG